MTQTQNCWSLTIAQKFFNFFSYVAQEVGNGIVVEKGVNRIIVVAICQHYWRLGTCVIAVKTNVDRIECSYII